MPRQLLRFALCAALLAPAALRAQNTYVDLTIGYSRPPTEKDSFAMSLSYARQARWWRVGATGDLLMSANESSYYWDGSRCRNGDNGQFASSYLCGPEMDLAVRTEAALRIPGTGISFGPGYRIATDSGPFAFAQVEIPMRDPSWLWLLRGSGGRNFVQIEAGAAIQLGRRATDLPQ
jgi:hypothetical protein